MSRGEGNGKGISPPQLTKGHRGIDRQVPQRGLGPDDRARSRNLIWCILNLTIWQLVRAFSWKWFAIWAWKVTVDWHFHWHYALIAALLRKVVRLWLCPSN